MLRKIIQACLNFIGVLKGVTFIEYLIIAAIIGILLAIFIPVFSDKPEQVKTITLIKDEWQCSVFDSVIVSYPVVSGSETIMMPRQEKVCTQYIRRQP